MILLDTEAAAKHYGVSARTVQRWVRQGRLRNYGTPRRVKVALLDKMSSKVCSSGDVSPQNFHPATPTPTPTRAR